MKKTFIGKTDLAVAYFPHIKENTARNKLMSLIHEDHSLMDSLTASGYKTLSRAFSPRQVELIFDAFGNPFS